MKRTERRLEENQPMSLNELKTVVRLLLDWEEEDFGSLPGFAAGNWSRRNLEALIDDVNFEINLNSPIAPERQNET